MMKKKKQNTFNFFFFCKLNNTVQEQLSWGDNLEKS